MINTNPSTCVERVSCPSTPPRVLHTAKVALHLKYASMATSALPMPITAKKTLGRTPGTAATKISGSRQPSRIPKRVPVKKKAHVSHSPIAVTSARSLGRHSVSRSSPLRKEVSLFELAFDTEPASFHDLHILPTAVNTPIAKDCPAISIGSAQLLQFSVERPLVSNFGPPSISKSSWSNKSDIPPMDLKENTEHLESSNEDIIHELLPTLSSFLPDGPSRRGSPRKKLLFWVRSHSRGLSEFLSKRSLRSSKEEH
ncbi:hypothetical protein [Phaffia rhodozyma]|uniref:Uncharacterized protein n=1 Tax=Phaffia rhodozyma TaxID=264483 RepID=A0A0F7SEM9_PHARH|nr:hypothetical protein [Phaffia rhodozyma]